MIEFGYNTELLRLNYESSSITTRFLLWLSSFDMICDYILIGVGTSNWNYLKTEYGIPFNVLLDPHNDYITILTYYDYQLVRYSFIFYTRNHFFVF